MKALISPNENNRIVEIVSNVFEVAYPLYWVDCSIQVTTEWSYENGIFSEPVVITPSIVYKPLSPAQIRLVLLNNNLLSQVETMVASSSQAVQIEWEFRTEYARDNLLLITMGQQLGLTEAQIDQLFIEGANI